MKNFKWSLLGCFVFWGFVFACSVNASPLLTCDCCLPGDNVIGGVLQFGTQTPIVVPVVQTCGTGTGKVVCVAPAVTICYDLGTMPNGPFSIKGMFTNVWGSSAYSLPLVGTKQLPSSPLLLRILFQ